MPMIIIRNDITKMKIDTIVNDVNTELKWEVEYVGQYPLQ